MVVLKSEEKGWKMSVVVKTFCNKMQLYIHDNNESARPPTLLKTESTTNILIAQSANFRTAALKNTYKRLLLLKAAADSFFSRAI